MSGEKPEMTRDSDDPVERARAHAKQKLANRFYKTASVAADGNGYKILLDERSVRSPGGNPLVVANADLAEAVAAEWRAQERRIDPGSMPLTRLVNSAIDAVARETGRVRADIVKYAGSDLLLYRAEAPDELAARQESVWSPIVEWAETRLGGRFMLAAGIVHVEQNPDVLAGADLALRPVDPLRLAAVHVVTTLTGSALLALAILENRLSADDAWAAAHLDEDWNMELWGRDEEALERRAARRKEFDAAAFVIAALTKGRDAE